MTWTGQNVQKHCLIFKEMVVNHYAIHVLSIVNCMPQHYIYTMYCYKTFH
jgi:AAA+ superfamily predicted ATPase